ncbi:Uncharacterised protein [Proteus mirabilis]|uniref:Uncharacterized protein n=1 Tax=Proteus mirabilis TaxID=584 RepID=A0A2X2DHK6_PROMI|nr:Uncharacterised protein [Proteus mirabilis]
MSLFIDNCVNNILHFYFPEKSQVTTLGQALLAHTPIEQAICDYQNGYQILPFGVVNSEDKLHLQASATANQHLQHFFYRFYSTIPRHFNFSRFTTRARYPFLNHGLRKPISY